MLNQKKMYLQEVMSFSLFLWLQALTIYIAQVDLSLHCHLCIQKKEDDRHSF